MRALLSNILLPQKIGSYYISAYRVVGIEITPYALYGTLVIYTAKTIKIKKSIKQLLDQDSALEMNQKIQQACDQIIKKIGSFDQLRVSFCSVYSVLKEIEVPFIDPYKISRMIKFELEPYLPFGSLQAVVTFIILSTTPQTSQLLSASSSLSQIAQYKEQLPQSWSNQAYLSVDMFDLYNLYSMSTPIHQKGIVFFIYGGYATTQIMCMVDNQLKLCRTLSKGIIDWANLLSTTLNTDMHNALESIIECGIQDTGKQGYLTSLQSIVQESMKPIFFTLQSFIATIDQPSLQTICYIAGPVSSIVNVLAIVQDSLNIRCAIYEPSTALSHFIIDKNSDLTPSSLLSLATALQTQLNQEINLNYSAQQYTNKKIVSHQLLTAVLLIGCSILMSGWYGFSIITSKKQQLYSIETNALKQLQSQNLTTKKRLVDALKDASQNVQAQEDIWSAFSLQKRFSFLYYLEQLTKVIDATGLGLHISRLSIDQTDNVLSIAGHVKDFEALKKLEANLAQADIFVYVPSMQSVAFDIVLLLKKL